MLPKTVKLAQRPKIGLTTVLPFIILVLFPVVFILRDGLVAPSPFVLHRSFRQEPYLNVVTLIYGQESDHVNIAHNCRIISTTRHKYFIHTDDLSQPYCTVCTCVRYNLFRCPCPTGSDGCKVKNPCEKVEFLIQSVNTYGSFLFLDNDLLIMKREFLDHMLQRSRAHDFLASYAHQTVNSSKYLRNFNSGLMFIRRLPNVDYNLLRASLYFHKLEQDQGVVSDFFQKIYVNWDSLSWKWHCRSLKRTNQDVPVEECYTIHDRSEVVDLLKELNRTRLSIP
eukprot:gb/GEZJ01003138.1/.p1 GENE.gb/GEZJ01003138.1/~~gb/GEZJ01003138.1/.p1  ORF type:complete len:281 (-),score=16.32 gb/GEZJ01003138.1/:701-1543(-)